MYFNKKNYGCRSEQMSLKDKALPISLYTCASISELPSCIITLICWRGVTVLEIVLSSNDTPFLLILGKYLFTHMDLYTVDYNNKTIYVIFKEFSDPNKYI